MARVGLPLIDQIRAAGLPLPVAEFLFAPPRRWRFDWCWPALMVAAEREGGVWTGGRHVRGAGYLKDMQKYNEAAILGWTLVRFTPEQERNGEALALIERAIRRKGWTQ